MNLLVIDDHPSMGDLLTGILADLNTYITCRQIPDFASLGPALRNERIDLIIIDYLLTDIQGETALSRLADITPNTPVVVISHCDDRETIKTCIAAGAAGFISKSSPDKVIGRAIQLVMDGGIFIPPQMLRQEQLPSRTIHQQQRISIRTTPPHTQARPICGQPLTSRQQGVLQCMLQGRSNKQIAYDLNISEWTVKAHVSAILKKLNVHNRVSAVIAARQLGLHQQASASL